MTVRPAKAADTMALIEYCKGLHARSIYDKLTFSETRAKRLFPRCVHFHGKQADGSTYFLISERDAKITGLFLGIVSPVYELAEELCAKDVYFYCDDPRDALTMFRGYLAWAVANEKVVEICASQSDFFGADAPTAIGLYKAAGFTQFGTAWRRTVER